MFPNKILNMFLCHCLIIACCYLPTLALLILPLFENFKPTILNMHWPFLFSPKIHPNDPSSISGQRPGSVLQIKWRPDKAQNPSIDIPMVNDYIELLSFIESSNEDIIHGKNLRTGNPVTVLWKTFFPIPYGGTCGCENAGNCRCIGENLVDLKKRNPTAILKSRPTTRLPSCELSRKYYTIKQIVLFDHDDAKLSYAVGDPIQILSHLPEDANLVQAKNLRTLAEGLVHFKAFRAVGVRKMCDCVEKNWNCDCVYEDFAKSEMFMKNLPFGVSFKEVVGWMKERSE